MGVVRQSIGPIIEAIIHRVEETVPRTYPDITFSAPRGSADAAAWIGDVNRRTRDFVVFTSGLPSYANPAAPCLFEQEITIAIVYRAEIPDDIRDILLSEDAITLKDAITQHPEVWGGADSVHSVQGISVEPFIDEEVLTIPLAVITH